MTTFTVKVFYGNANKVDIYERTGVQEKDIVNAVIALQKGIQTRPGYRWIDTAAIPEKTFSKKKIDPIKANLHLMIQGLPVTQPWTSSLNLGRQALDLSAPQRYL